MAWNETPLHRGFSCYIAKHTFEWTIVQAREINPLPVEILVRSRQIRVLVLAKQERAVLSYQHGVRPRLRCDGMAADIVQLQGLVEQQAVLQLYWAVRCQALPNAAHKVAYVYRGMHFSAVRHARCCLKQLCE